MERIFQTPVPPLFPQEGPVRLILYGEAPGPLGADKSGIPFWGDRAGKPLYQALQRAGLAFFPAEALTNWNGITLKKLQHFPVLREIALSNAYPSCPTRDGQHFKAPTNKELGSPENRLRVQEELKLALERAEGWKNLRLKVIAMGKRAEWLLKPFQETLDFDFLTLPHPSAQGLLQAAPNKGKGLKLSDLQSEWENRLIKLLTRA